MYCKKWEINFPDNPYNGQIFWDKESNHLFEFHSIDKNVHSHLLGESRWLIVTSQNWEGCLYE